MSHFFRILMMDVETYSYSILPSTQTFVKQNFQKFAKGKMTCIVAEQQTAGRGRGRRRWLSFPGSLCMSLFFETNAPFPCAQLSLLLALSTIESLKPYGVPANIKWPNDLMIHGMKFGGILGEAIFQKDTVAMILGIGLNLSLSKSEREQIDQPATSLHCWMASPPEKRLLQQNLCTLFSKKITLWQRQGFAPFQERFHAHLSK